MGFVAMNPSRHFESHWDFYHDLVRGDLEDAESHRRFYDEYTAVLDMPAEYYFATIRIVFQQHQLPRGERAEEHTSELQSLMSITYAILCLNKKNKIHKWPKILYIH